MTEPKPRLSEEPEGVEVTVYDVEDVEVGLSVHVVTAEGMRIVAGVKITTDGITVTWSPQKGDYKMAAVLPAWFDLRTRFPQPEVHIDADPAGSG